MIDFRCEYIQFKFIYFYSFTSVYKSIIENILCYLFRCSYRIIPEGKDEAEKYDNQGERVIEKMRDSPDALTQFANVRRALSFHIFFILFAIAFAYTYLCRRASTSGGRLQREHKTACNSDE